MCGIIIAHPGRLGRRPLQRSFSAVDLQHLLAQFTLNAAKLLLGGSTYDQIVKAVEISTATISRINRCIQYGSGGYRDTIEKVQKSAKPE